VGAASGRIDAIAFMAGLIAGVWVFAEAYTLLASFVWSGDLGAITLADVLGVPFAVLAGALLMVTAILAVALRRIETRRAKEGA
jgi:membrane protein implicated in regulation of membrane protease activity